MYQVVLPLSGSLCVITLPPNSQYMSSAQEYLACTAPDTSTLSENVTSGCNTHASSSSWQQGRRTKSLNSPDMYTRPAFTIDESV